MFKRLFGGKKKPQSPEEQAREIQRLIAAGNKLEAIKVYRELSGLGLAEAKKHIDAMAAELKSGSATSEPFNFPEAILDELEHKRKIQAIKFYREATGVGLKEAKEAVETAEEALDHGRDHARVILSQSMAHVSPPPPSKAPPADADMQMVVDELLAGNKIKAIKIYRELKGVSLREAKEYVEQLEQQLK